MVWTRLVDALSSRAAFCPPDPPSYELAEHGDGAREAYLRPTRRGLRPVPRAVALRVPLPGRGGGEVVAALVAPPGGAPRGLLLHSHGNAVDLAQMLPLYEQLAARCNVSVLGYDYPGYGRSTPGPPAASAALRAAAAVFAAAEGLGFPPARVVLYGQSVGSGPAAWLGAREAGVAGVVLHSAFLSGVRVLRPGLRRWPAFLDIFSNASEVPKIASPVLVVHGEDDAVVGAAQGRALHALCQRPAPPLFASGAGHDDLEAHPRYLPTLKRFLEQVLG